MPNHLINETSPYLLQHAHNPVNWYPWGEEALAKARAENKPIFLSIGYAACHWCHVMAHESFENAETAAYMNEHFVSIKVDREERPDLDSIYMQAATAMTGSGGWPMSVFLTPDLRPFYAGTYFPPVKRHNMPSFRDVLNGLVNAWENEHTELERVGNQLAQHLRQVSMQSASNDTSFTQEDLRRAAAAITEAYDWGHGGWGDAPKFPQPMTIEFLLRRIDYRTFKELKNLPAMHALKSMARGGMYDVVGGGFSRYSTDNFWRVPHFEKMLYDNAQLALAYLHAWQITREPFFKRIVIETLDFVGREMIHPDGGFFSSLDADSEGKEGKFYVWTKDEIKKTLDDSDFEFFVAAYGITDKGNWEGRTVLQRALDDASLAASFKLDEKRVAVKLTDCHSQLLAVRAPRPRPGTDDKVLTAWNGLMLHAFAEAARFI
ncbi:MAG: thioredoxin domain-containing protein, partial [Chloroflexi bacterium]|nr:thioredoxin domain-containing protein [Chloroflexota bacterium]